MTELNGTKTIVDFSEVYCPNCGPNHILDHLGEGLPGDDAWCEACGWEGTCQDLLDFLSEGDADGGDGDGDGS